MEDEKLLASIANGDEFATEVLIEKYKPLVKIIARRYYLLGGEIEDLVQEGTIGLYFAIKSYKDDKNTSFKTYASVCILRQILTAIKKASRVKNNILLHTVYCDFFDDVLSDNNTDYNKLQMHLSNELNPEEKVISKEQQQEIKDFILKNLTLLEKQILYEFLKGKNYYTIAKDLKINAKSVDNGLSRIRTKLNNYKM